MSAARATKSPRNPFQAHGTAWEEEPDASGTLVPTAVVFLTNRECPFRCVMCDLWVNTLDATVPSGAIAMQVRAALASLPGARAVKLYNAGSFFDPQAIPPDEDAAIAEAVGGFDRVIVEAHPAFLIGRHGERCLRFRDRIGGRLEVAIGLETAHSELLARLDKKMTLQSFRQAATFLHDGGIDLRVFVILFAPPFLPPAEGVEWARRSIDVARECGAGVVSVIPLRGGQPPPTLSALERVVEYGLADRSSRVFADLWDVARLFDCECAPARADRLSAMNRTQKIPPPVTCACDTRL